MDIMKNLTLNLEALKPLRTVDSRLMSYNVEMTEVTGGTFWKEYTPGQIAGTEEFPPIKSFDEIGKLMQWYNPVDLYDSKLRKLASNFGPVWVRVSGTWATKTYYDFEGTTGGKAPEGFQSVLTKEQWIGVLEFVKAVGGKLLVSIGNCQGNHPEEGGPIDLSQARKLFKFSSDYGVPIQAAEFMNEPNMFATSGAPNGYTPADYARDQDIFFDFLRNEYPDCLVVGPCTTDSNAIESEDGKGGAGIADVVYSCSTHELMNGSHTKLDAFSYHYYNGVSERLGSVMPSAHWPAEAATTEAYLAMAGKCADAFGVLRDRYCPNGQMWVTESGDAGGGGDTWASTYLDVLRTLNELGEFSEATDGIIFHNTLCSSDYGFLCHGTFDPRPNYWAVLLWNRLMGTEVFETGIPTEEGAHVFAHSRKDGKNGKAYLIINNSLTEDTEVDLPADCERYTLSSDALRSTKTFLNGKELSLDSENNIPALNGEKVAKGKLALKPCTCTFLVF